MWLVIYPMNPQDWWKVEKGQASFTAASSLALYMDGFDGRGGCFSAFGLDDNS